MFRVGHVTYLDSNPWTRINNSDDDNNFYNLSSCTDLITELLIKHIVVLTNGNKRSYLLAVLSQFYISTLLSKCNTV